VQTRAGMHEYIDNAIILVNATNYCEVPVTN